MNIVAVIVLLVLGWTAVAVPIAVAAGRALKVMGDALDRQQTATAHDRQEADALVSRVIDQARIDRGAFLDSIATAAETAKSEREALLRNMIALSGATQSANLARMIQADVRAHAPADLAAHMETLERQFERHADEGMPRGATLVGMGD